MKTSGLFTTHKYKVTTKTNKPVRLIVFGDIHRDSPNHAHGHWKRFLSEAKKMKDAVFLCMGDALDSTSTTERECLGKISHTMHETFRNDIQALQMAKVELIAKELEFMKGRLIGMINGNHFFRFSYGTNSDQEICKLLSCQYLGVCSFIRLYITRGHDSRHPYVDLFVHHGKGGARLPGGSLNNVNQMLEFAECDLAIMGHDHKRGVWPANPTIRLTQGKGSDLVVKERQRWIGRSGSFLASYEPGVSNYNVDACRGPSSLGWIEFELTLRRDTSGGSDKEWIDIRGIA